MYKLNATNPVMLFIISVFGRAYHYLGISMSIIGDMLLETHPSYFVLGFIFSVFAGIIWISVKYPFWNAQPVFHTYDFWRGFAWDANPYIIQKIPTKTRYYDKTGGVKTVRWDSVSRPTIQKMLKLVNSCLIPSDRILLDMQEAEWTANFDDDTCVSILRGQGKDQDEVDGLITSRPVLSRIGTYETQLKYVDYLAVSRDSKPNASKMLFSTHEYNVRLFDIGLGNKPTASLIKGGEYVGVVPFIKYELVQYHMDKLAPWALPIMPNHIQVVSCVAQTGVGKKRKYENTDILNDFAKSFMELPMFDVKIWPGLPSLLRQFSAGSLQMYALRSYGNVLAIYFMRNARTYYEELDGANTLECVASVCLTEDRELFYGGFLLSIRESINKQMYGVLSVPGIGHNVFLNDALPKKDVMLRSPSEYILHNMVAPKSPYSPERTLIIL